MAKVGERRRFGQQIAEWDGNGWVPVQPEATGEDAVRQANIMPVPGEEEVLGTYARLPEETLRTVSRFLPAAGATVGAVAGGGPLSIPGAALGGAGGEAARRLVNEVVLADEPPTGGAEAAADIGTEAAIDAAIPGVFRAGGALGRTAAGRVLKGAAGSVARAATSPTGIGVAVGAEELKRTGSPVKALERGVEAGIGRKYAPRLIRGVFGDMLKHALKRAGSLEKAAAEATATKAAPVAKEAVKATPGEFRHGAGKIADKETMEKAGDVVFGKIKGWIEAGMSEGQVTNILREQYGVEAASGKEMFKLVKQMVAK